MNEKILINFLRHGETDYVEDEKRERGEDMTFPEIDITPLGIEQVTATAEQLADEIDPTHEDVILLSSPSWRAQGSEKIIEDHLTQKGIPILKKKVSPTIGPTHGKHNYEQESKKVERNAMRFVKWAAIAAKKYKGVRGIRVISVSHYEFLTPIMQRLFNFDIHNGEGYKKAELLNISFRLDTNLDRIIISAQMRDRERRNVYFDPEAKEFRDIIPDTDLEAAD